MNSRQSSFAEKISPFVRAFLLWSFLYMNKIFVRPATAGQNLTHPAGNIVLPDAGGYWPDDQFTARRLRDGNIIAVNKNIPLPTPISPTAASAANMKKNKDEK